MSKSRHLRPERACSAGGAWWLCSCPRGPNCLFSTFSVFLSTCAGFLFRCSTLCAMLPLYPSQYQLPHTHLTECDPMSCCHVTKDQNAEQTCMCAMFELLEFHVLSLRVPLVTSPLLCSRVPCRVGLRHGRSV